MENLQYEKKHPDIEWWVTNILQKQNIDLNEAEHIIDWINQYEQNSGAPTRLRKLSFTDARRLAADWTKRLMKKGQDIVELETDTETVFTDGKFRVVRLLTKDSFNREGNLMRHCLGSYYGKSNIEIYSLRDENNQPHATLELSAKENSFTQVKGKGNGHIHPKYIKTILTFFKMLDIPVRNTELKNLGYRALTEEIWNELDRNWTGVKEITLGETRYIYIDCEPHIKEVKDKQ